MIVFASISSTLAPSIILRPLSKSTPQSMSDGGPSFAFVFRGGLGQPLHDIAEADVAAGKGDFVWVHLDLRDAAAQAWVSRRTWPRDIIEAVAAPIQWGRLFVRPDLVYGHLRDFRDEPGAGTLEAGSLSVAATRTLLVTGRRIPLLSVKELLRRVESGTVRLESPCGLITEFFRALNDIGERLLQQASERLSALESKVLKREGAGQRKDILEMRRDSIRVARDMAYKRTAMLEFTRARPVLFPAEEFDRFDRQIHRYAALGEDTQDYAERCQFLVEELRAQVEEETNRNLYTLTMFSVIFLPATLIASIWGMNVGGIPFSGSSNGFWLVAGLIAAIFTFFAIVLYWFRFRFF